MVQAAAMARRFYLEGKSKIQIAEEFGVSRFKVARVLETALERDLVRIEIRVPAELDAERSDALRAHYGLRHAVVVRVPGRPGRRAPDPENLGEVAADLLGELVTEGDVLGLAWGRSIIPWPTPSTGCRPARSSSSPASTTRAPPSAARSRRCARAAQVSGGEAHPMYAPDAARPTRPPRRRCAPRAVSPRAMSYFDKVTVAVVSIGSWEAGISTVHDMLTDAERAHYAVARGRRRDVRAPLRRARAAGSAATWASGASPSRRTGCAASPRCVAIAGGTRKAAAIDAVLRSGLVTSLVTDTAAADHLLHATAAARRPALDRADPDGSDRVRRPGRFRAAGPAVAPAQCASST